MVYWIGALVPALVEGRGQNQEKQTQTKMECTQHRRQIEVFLSIYLLTLLKQVLLVTGGRCLQDPTQRSNIQHSASQDVSKQLFSM